MSLPWWDWPDDEQTTADARERAAGWVTTIDDLRPPAPGTGWG